MAIEDGWGTGGVEEELVGARSVAKASD